MSKFHLSRVRSLRFASVLLSSVMAVSIASAEATSGGNTPATAPAEPGATGPHKVKVQDRALAAAIGAQGGRLVADYGGFQIFQVEQVDAKLLAQPGIELRDDFNIIRLNAATLDTTAPQAQARRTSVGSFAGKRLHLVQFAGPPQPAWREGLQAAGARIVSYIPQNAYLVYGDAQALGQVQAQAASAPELQWEGPYLDEYKINPRARPTDAQGNPRQLETDSFAIQLVADAKANAGTLQLLDQLKLEPFERQENVLEYVNVVVRLAPENLQIIAERPDVISIQLHFAMQRFCERQAQIVAGNLAGNTPSGPGYLAWLASKGFNQAQFAASGFVVDVSDSGLDNGTTSPNHPNLYVQGNVTSGSRVVYNRLIGTPNQGSTLKGCDGHGTINAHIIGGYDDFPAGFPHTDTDGYHYGLGVCPFVKLGSSVIFDPNGWTRPNFVTLAARAYESGARVSNNSWGSPFSMGDYDIESQLYDSLVRDAQLANSPFPTAGNQEMVFVFAAGNMGEYRANGSVSSPSTAKNVIAVGAAENVQPFGGMDGSGIDDDGADSANDIISFSSRGPCTDGRHKPDLMAPGTHVSGGVAQAVNPGPTGTADPCFDGSGVSGGTITNVYPDGQQLFTASSGTSQAAPGAAGACALVRQYFLNKYTNAPSPAMTKAFLMNAARYMTGQDAGDDLWSDNQGMGEINLGTAFDGTARDLHDQAPAEIFTASGQMRTFTGKVVDAGRPFRVTLAWTDAPGSTTGGAFNNDLDLVVTVGGNTYKGNYFKGASSAAGGRADAINNVESVFLPAGISGPYSVTVSAASINSDGVPNNLTQVDQDFALVIYNAMPGNVPNITVQPTNATVLTGWPVNLAVGATGSAPLSYQWTKNGAPIVGATTNTYAIPSAQTNHAGAYSVVIANPIGTITSAVATVSVVVALPLDYALNATNLTWTTDSAMPWFGQSSLSHDSVAAGRSWFISDRQQTTMRTRITGPATLTFWWKVSSQANADVLTFSSTAATWSEQAQISGEVNWQQKAFYLPEGSVSLAWTYSKDGSQSGGRDAGWVDQVSITPGGTGPILSSQPVGQNTFAGLPVTLNVTAGGTPPLSYQWTLNGTTIPGATGSAYVLAAAGPSDSGTYAVVVSNAFGVVTSADAKVAVVPVIEAGNNDFQQVQIPLNSADAIGIAAGSWHNLALRADGTVMAWGDGWNGQCRVPTNAVGVTAVAAGGYHSLALRSDGTVVGWGADDAGQATPPPGLSNLTAIAAGSWHSLALKANGTVVGWGDNSWGQLNIPPGLTSVTAIAAAGNHCLALRADGTVIAWGENTDADGLYAGQSSVPWGLTNVVAIGAGEYHSIAVKADGTVTLWGANADGQCQAPPNLSRVIAAAGGGAHTVVLKADGTVVAWGANWDGECNLPGTLTNVVSVAAGTAHTLVLVGNPPSAPKLLKPARSQNQFSVSLATHPSKHYALEYKNSLEDAQWTVVQTVRGNGAQQSLTDSNAGTPKRFYRVRMY